MQPSEYIIKEYLDFLENPDFPCVAAKAAQSKNRAHCFVAGHMGCPADDVQILQFLYHFVDLYRVANEPYYSASIIFNGPMNCSEQEYDAFLWARLSSLASIDRMNGYKHDRRVDGEPTSPRFSFSLKEEAFFIVGLHPGSNRRSRQFKYPTLVFNPHAEFEKLRALDRYEKMKKIVRKRDTMFSGSVNPVLSDFGERSEVYQYSGIAYDSEWVCPLKKYE
jgi:uncharacterized protein